MRQEIEPGKTAGFIIPDEYPRRASNLKKVSRIIKSWNVVWNRNRMISILCCRITGCRMIIWYSMHRMTYSMMIILFSMITSMIISYLTV